MKNKKYLIVADIHASMIALDRLLMLVQEHKPDNVLILGDTFGVDADVMVQKLNTISDKLVIVKGNNDWYYQPQNARFEFWNDTYIDLNGHTCYVCHGHRLDDMNLENYGADVILQGHIHRPFIEKYKGITRICVGSIASPRFGSEKCYALAEGQNIKIYNLDNEIIDEVNL